ncbi:MAG TPA: glycerol kinase GlpK [Chthonomonadaceae bacterium]|nr:glycerol kinase GlpK [Chthonomonadaceae bacterium]
MGTEKFILALDQGTTSSRAILFDAAGRVRGVEQQEFPQIYPQPAWVEHNPEDIWNSQLAVAARLLQSQNVSASDIAAIGLTNQRETTLLWERATGRPVANAIVWQDRRTAPLCDELRAAGHAPLFQSRTGLTLDPYFSGTKVRWLLDSVPGLRERAQRGEIAFGTVDSFLLSRLSGGKIHATDVSNASRTLLYNIVTGDWDDEILALLDIPRALLPEVKPSSALYGETVPSLLGAPVPLAGVAGDQQAATFGQACLQPGMVKNTYGTGSFLLMNTGQTPHFSDNGLLTTIAWQIGDKITYALEGSVFITGAAVQWLRDELQIIRTAAEIEPLAASVPDSGGVYFVPAFVGLGAPYWDAYARGTIVGLTRGAGRAHIARATLEAVCYQTRDVLEAMRADSGLEIAELRVDGGMTVNNLLLQMQADLLGVAVVRPAVTETTALGAAYLAGLAVGYWRDTSEIAANWAIGSTFHPQIGAEERAAHVQGWQRAVERARAWAA